MQEERCQTYLPRHLDLITLEWAGMFASEVALSIVRYLPIEGRLWHLRELADAGRNQVALVFVELAFVGHILWNPIDADPDQELIVDLEVLRHLHKSIAEQYGWTPLLPLAVSQPWPPSVEWLKPPPRRKVAVATLRCGPISVKPLERCPWGWPEVPTISGDLLREFCLIGHRVREGARSLRKSRECDVAQEEGRLPEQADPLPPKPTRTYCLPRAKVVRWKKETPVPPRLWHLLGALLDRRVWPVPLTDLEEISKQKKDKSWRNDVSELTSALEVVGFPWSIRLNDGAIHRD